MQFIYTHYILMYQPIFSMDFYKVYLLRFRVSALNGVATPALPVNPVIVTVVTAVDVDDKKKFNLV